MSQLYWFWDGYYITSNCCTTYLEVRANFLQFSTCLFSQLIFSNWILQHSEVLAADYLIISGKILISFMHQGGKKPCSFQTQQNYRAAFKFYQYNFLSLYASLLCSPFSNFLNLLVKKNHDHFTLCLILMFPPLEIFFWCLM